MQIIASIFQTAITFIGILVVVHYVAYAIAKGVYKARAKYPHVTDVNWNLGMKMPSLSELKRRMMDEVEKAEKEKQPPAQQA